VICSGCDYLDASAGTYLGLHDPTATDQSTFDQHGYGAGSVRGLLGVRPGPGW
jgi:hypothetical protein